MSTTQPERPDEDKGEDSLAAEFVLGALPMAEQAALAHRAETDPTFARLVAAWEERLLPLAEHYEAQVLPAATKQALDRRLFGAAVPEAGRFWNNLVFWRAVAGLATAAFLLVVSLPPLMPVDDASPRLMASLSAEASEVHYMAFYDPEQRSIGLSHMSGSPAAGQDFELWMIHGEEAPVSLGVIPAGASAHMVLTTPKQAGLAAGAMLAISVEPAGGSPTGRPTGAMVAAGDLRDI